MSVHRSKRTAPKRSVQGTRSFFVLVVATMVAAGCTSKTYEARLSSSGGVAEGAPVLVAGTPVGEVDEVRIEDNQAVIEFEIDSKHDVRLTADACAVGGTHLDSPALVVLPGDAAGEGETTLRACSFNDIFDEVDLALPDIEIDFDAEEAGRQVGEAAREFTDGVADGWRESP